MNINNATTTQFKIVINWNHFQLRLLVEKSVHHSNLCQDAHHRLCFWIESRESHKLRSSSLRLLTEFLNMWCSWTILLSCRRKLHLWLRIRSNFDYCQMRRFHVSSWAFCRCCYLPLASSFWLFFFIFLFVYSPSESPKNFAKPKNFPHFSTSELNLYHFKLHTLSLLLWEW